MPDRTTLADTTQLGFKQGVAGSNPASGFTRNPSRLPGFRAVGVECESVKPALGATLGATRPDERHSGPPARSPGSV